jgi:EAL domain-containing protein (putative c-di-GMP-specific phosphodiesterase class I)
VRDIVRDPVSESMVAAINQVGQAMQLETVAEFVENDEIKKMLNTIGVDYGQGYGIGKPGLFRNIQAKLEESA